ncbi:MAG: DUF4832 domain-containing protein [Prevotellaceae bacterium]|jgi:hypothetical protein|nr:DUF4832 domain-containing protein [Prevotellaceae bacterium]
MKNAVFLFAVLTAFSWKTAAQLPDASTAADPIWYYIQVQGVDSDAERVGRVLTVLSGDSKVYGRLKTTSTDEAELGKQLWRFEQSGSSYVVINKATNKKLDVAYYSEKSISVASLSDSPAIGWKLSAGGSGYSFQATAAPSGGDGGKTYIHQANNWDGRDFVMMLETTTYISSFAFVPFKEFRFDVSDGSNEFWYFVTSAKPGYEGRCVTAVAGSATLSLESAAAGNAHQQWKIVEKSSDGAGKRLQLVNRATGSAISTAVAAVGNYACPQLAANLSADNGWIMTHLGSGQYEVSDVRSDSSAVYWNASLSSEAQPDLYVAGSSLGAGFAWIFEKADTYAPPTSPSAETGLFLSVVAPKAPVDIAPLWNPDRGLHLESIYQVDVDGAIANPYGRGAGQGAVGDEVYPAGFMDTRNEDFQSWGDSVTLTQLYIYLTSFWEVDSISPKGLEHIQQLFDGLREHKVKAILRFAYSRDNGRIGNGHTGANPDYARMMKHIAQLKPLLEKNFDVISFIEAGFMGTWGEWTPNFGKDNNNSIATALFSAIPDGYGIVVRYTYIKNDLKAVVSEWDYDNRIGFANDYFTSGVKNCGSSDICLDSEEYWKIADGSFTVFMRGEVPYNEGPPWGFDIFMEIDRMLRYFKDHHYTTMDITQNFKDNITRWKTLIVYPDLLRKYNVFFDEAYFKDASGATVPRSFYQFTRDHLGYRLNLLPASTVEVSENTLRYDLKITNTGFATVLNPRPVYLVLIDKGGNIVREERLSVNPREWQPWAKGDSATLLTHSISGSLPLELPSGEAYRVGLWLPDSFASIRYNPAYCIKFATDNKAITHWTDAENTRTVNIVGRVGEDSGENNGPGTAAAPLPETRIKVYACDGYIRVEGTNATPAVYNLMGGKLNPAAKLPIGIYIVKVDGVVAKVLVN